MSDSHRPFLPNLCNGASVLVVIVVAQLLALVTTLTASLYADFSLQRLALSSLFIQWVALTSAALLCALRPRINALPLNVAAVVVVALVVLDAFVFSLAAAEVYAWLTEGLLIDRGSALREALISAAIAVIIGSLVMRYFYLQEQLKQKDQAELQARIQALQSRIRPHFLFNSMNIITSLISVDPDTAEQVVEDLAKLFRASLGEVGSLVPLQEELSLVQRYIHIEQLRMGERLQVDWDIDINAELISIPLLSLQPLVENALYHGIQPLGAGGLLEISAHQYDDEVEIRIRNPKPAGHSRHQGNRMALENIRLRFAALYGRRGQVDVYPSDDHYQVVLRYPATQDTDNQKGASHASTGLR